MTIVLGVVSFALAALFIHSRIRLHQQQSLQNAEKAKLEDELARLQTKVSLSSLDPVTKLLGWSLFEDRVTQGIKECARYKFIMGVLYIDIDNFKLMNSAMGYEAANGLLLEVAERLQVCIRQVDSITRQGKDTFVVMLAQLAKQETAAIIIQRMLQSLSQPFLVKGNNFSLTVGIGAAFYPGDGLTAGELMHNAEYAMLLAKGRGKHQYQFYQPEVQADSQRELAIYNSLSSDLFLDDIKLFYQPVMNIDQQSMFCADAQIQWKHAICGDVTSNELFTYADRHNKLNKITERVLAEACHKFQHWREIGLKPQMIAVPVFLKQLENTQFIYRLSQIMQEHKMQPAWVMLEIRECVTPISLDVLEKAFNMLNYLGVKIAIDNFGAGSFSLRYLKFFSVHYLKLDPAMVDDIVSNESSRMIVKAMIAFAEVLSLKVIASGVDQEDQVAVLRDLGITLMQGRWLSQPLSEKEMADKMTNV